MIEGWQEDVCEPDVWAGTEADSPGVKFTLSPAPYPRSGMFTPLDLLRAFLWGSGWESTGNSAQTEAHSALLSYC